MNKDLKFYSIYRQDNEFELWGGPCHSKEAALSQGELKVLDTYGSKSKNYMNRVRGLFTVDEFEAKYLKVA
jgi:hypothetical protein